MNAAQLLWTPPGTIHVTLTLTQFCAAQRAVADRMEQSGAAGLNHASTMQRDLPTRQLEELVGAGAEAAWSVIKGVPWHAPINEFHNVPDDGRTAEIRATRHRNGCLILRDNDADHHPYIFATGDGATYTFHGWLYGHEGKQDQFIRNPHGYRRAWFIPQHALKPIPESVITNTTYEHAS